MNIPDYCGIGVYVIRNKNNGKFYVGSSENIRSRAKGHDDLMKADKHFVPAMQNDYNNGHRFVFDVIRKFEGGERSEMLDDAINYERATIEKMNAIECGYNRVNYPQMMRHKTVEISTRTDKPLGVQTRLHVLLAERRMKKKTLSEATKISAATISAICSGRIKICRLM